MSIIATNAPVRVYSQQNNGHIAQEQVPHEDNVPGFFLCDLHLLLQFCYALLLGTDLLRLQRLRDRALEQHTIAHLRHA